MNEEKVALSSGNLLNCPELKRQKFNLKIMGEIYSTIILHEECGSSSSIFGFILEMKPRKKLVITNKFDARHVEFCGELMDKIAFFLVLKKKAIEELDCSSCKFNCMIEQSLKAYMA